MKQERKIKATFYIQRDYQHQLGKWLYKYNNIKSRPNTDLKGINFILQSCKLVWLFLNDLFKLQDFVIFDFQLSIFLSNIRFLKKNKLQV